MVVHGKIDEIVKQMQPKRVVEIDCPGHAASASAQLHGRPGVVATTFENDTVLVEFAGDANELSRLLTFLVGGGVAVTRFVEKRFGVEDIMLQLDGMEMT